MVNDEIQLVVATKKATLLMPPSGTITQMNVAIRARCSSVKIPAKLIDNLSL